MSEGYAVIPRQTFNQPWFQGLSDRGRVAALYLAAGPHSNIIGAYLMPDGYMSADLNLPIETVPETVSELSDKGFAKRFGDGRYILLCHHCAWNTIANPNVMKAALKQLAALPPDPCLSVVFEWLKPLAERFKKGLPNELETVRRRFFLPFSQPFRNTEAEAEAEAEAETESENKAGEEQKGGPETVDNSPVPLKDACGQKFERLVARVGGELAYRPWLAGAMYDRATNTAIATTREKAEHVARAFMVPMRDVFGDDLRITDAEQWRRSVAA